jgi:hypothetical protein
MNESTVVQETEDGDGTPSVAGDTIPTGRFLGPIFTRTFYVALVMPLLFALLGASGVLAPLAEQASWLIARMAPIWPSLPPQYELVLRIRGPGHAASFGFMCAALWVWAFAAAGAFLRAHARRRESVLPISRKEKGVFFSSAAIRLFLPSDRHDSIQQLPIDQISRRPMGVFLPAFISFLLYDGARSGSSDLCDRPHHHGAALAPTCLISLFRSLDFRPLVVGGAIAWRKAALDMVAKLGTAARLQQALPIPRGLVTLPFRAWRLAWMPS